VLQHLGPVRGNSTAEAMSRLGDIAFACVLLTFTLPLLLIVALAIRLESPGPVLERQACIGAGGRRFQMLKFRTEICGSSGAAPGWAISSTTTGRFLQYTRIEYLPQLLNLLRGDLSILDPQKRSPSFLH
jgi:lipopolysaccharide/colanic/teichoic acid biosynthesis glycosyltransferase